MLVARFDGEEGIGVPTAGASRRFGSTALTVGGSIFAMLSQGELVVKLPSARVADLVADGTGRPFTSGAHRVMRQWLVVAGDDLARWESLSREALAFVRR